jgi:hypothetical protein
MSALRHTARPSGKLLPVRLVSRGKRHTLQAGGESVTFEGDLVHVDGDGVLRSQVTPERREFGTRAIGVFFAW